MSDDLLRRFRDKIRGRPSALQNEAAAPAAGMDDEEAVEPDGIAIRAVDIGPFPEAGILHPRFVPGAPRARLTLDIGAALRRRRPPIHAEEARRLLELCPRLGDHDCGGLHDVGALLRAEPAADDVDASGVPSGDEDGLALAHLIEHVAIELSVRGPDATRCSGVTCAHQGRLDRFDIFLECADPVLARAALMLAVAAVRDLCRGSDRLHVHRRCRDLIGVLASTRRRDLAPEDVESALGWDTPETLAALEELARLGYVEAVAAPFTFSSRTGRLFRRSAPVSAPGPGWPPGRVRERAAVPPDRGRS